MRRSTKARYFMTIGSPGNKTETEPWVFFKKIKQMRLRVRLVLAAVAKRGLINAALTDTQGLELVLGVGERCTVTSAIQ